MLVYVRGSGNPDGGVAGGLTNAEIRIGSRTIRIGATMVAEPVAMAIATSPAAERPHHWESGIADEAWKDRGPALNSRHFLGCRMPSPLVFVVVAPARAAAWDPAHLGRVPCCTALSSFKVVGLRTVNFGV